MVQTRISPPLPSHHRRNRYGFNHGPPDRVHQHDGCSGPGCPGGVLLGYGPSACAGLHSSGTHRARPDRSAWHDGAPEHSLHHCNFNHYGPDHWHRGGLHHPHHSPLPGNIPGPGPERAAIQTLSTTGLHSWVGIDNGIGNRSACCFPVGSHSTVWLHRRHYHPLLSHCLSPGGAAAYDDMGAYQNMRLRSNMRRWAAELDEAVEAVHRRGDG